MIGLRSYSRRTTNNPVDYNFYRYLDTRLQQDDREARRPISGNIKRFGTIDERPVLSFNKGCEQL